MNALLRLSGAIDAINRFVGKTVSWLILIAIVVSAGNAAVRKLFDASSNAWLELQWYLYGAAFLLAAAYTLMENEHIRIDILYGLWPRRVQHWIDLIGATFFLMPFVIVMLWLLFPYVITSFESGEHSGNAGGLIIWPSKALILAGFLLLAIQGVSEIIKKIGVMRGLIADPHAHHSSHQPIDMEATSGEGGR